MNRTVLCFLFVFCLLSFSAVQAEPARLVPLDAKLEIVSGQIKLTRVGSTKTDLITQSCELYSGDLLETLQQSKAALVYGDGTKMRIKERTLVEVQPMSIKVFKGKTWYKFTKRGTEFRIETPTLIAGIRGTEFEVAVSSRKKASVSVVEGAVAVNSVPEAAAWFCAPAWPHIANPEAPWWLPINSTSTRKRLNGQTQNGRSRHLRPKISTVYSSNTSTSKMNMA